MDSPKLARRAMAQSAAAALLATCLLAGAGPVVWAAGAAPAADHPLLSRMPGYVLEAHQVEDFGARQLGDAVLPGRLLVPVSQLAVQGRVTQIAYVDEQERGSVLALYRNHLQALARVGGEAINTGFTPQQVATGGRFLFRVPRAGGGAPTWVALDLASDTYRYVLTIVEPTAMRQAITAQVLSDDLQRRGQAVLHILFATGRAELPADGQALVGEVVALLRQQPSLKLSIEGHTDNVGQPADNRQLSHARAEAVRQAVVAQGIAADRLRAQGHGDTQPVADNRSETGRASNRRVALVRW